MAPLRDVRNTGNLTTEAAMTEPKNGRFRSHAGDPTENVKALSEAANKRQDDLREATEKLIYERQKNIETNIELRGVHQKYIAQSESRRVDEQAALRAYYSERLELAEAKRIDAIRAVDVSAVSVASQRAADQASVLATQVQQSAEQLRSQVAQSAEALRSLVATTAATAATTLQQLVGGLSVRLTTLEQAQYEGKGKQAYSDPAFNQLFEEVKTLRGTKSEGISIAWAAMLAVGGLVFGAAAFFIAHQSNSPQTQPQVIYLPSPQAVPPANIVPPR